MYCRGIVPLKVAVHHLLWRKLAVLWCYVRSLNNRKRKKSVLLWYMVFLNLLYPSFSICPLISTMSTVVSLQAYFSREKSRIRSAISAVPPATSMHFWGPRLPGCNEATKSSFHSRWAPADVMSFMKSYFEATESKTSRTILSLASSGTVLKPKEANRGGPVEDCLEFGT